MPTQTYTLQEAAALIGIGPNRLFSMLRARRVLDNNNLPTPSQRDTGRFVVKIGEWQSAIGARAYGRTLVTHEGLGWLKTQIEKTQQTGSPIKRNPK